MTAQIKDALGVQVEGELPKLDKQLLEDCLNWAIRSHNGALMKGEPSWYQGQWFVKSLSGYTIEYMRGYGEYAAAEGQECGTAACMAGNAVMMTGNLDIETGLPKETIEVRGELVSSVDDADVCNCGCNGGSDWHKAGQLLYGLTANEATSFFSASNSIFDLIDKGKVIAAHRGETLNLLEVESDD